ncbi:19594_t:CDS:2 [Rhizophagus irregularis]|nr:19594_t:CDS:2 [Rhizophagus irregularis]
MGGRENSSSKLIMQIATFRDNLSSYNNEFVPKYYTIEREENFIQQLALKIFSITPHNAGYERIFFVMGWYMNKRRTCVNHLQNLTKLHTYYVSNAKTELKYMARDMNVKNDEEFYQLLRNGIYQNINDEIGKEELDNEDKDYGDTEDELIDIEEYEKFGYKSNDSILQSKNYFNFVSKKLVELLKLQELRVVIEPVNVDHIVDHGNENFDIEKLLDQQFSEDDDVNV